MSKFLNYLKAGFPLLGVETHEEDRAINTLAAEAPAYDIYSWDIIGGLKDHQHPDLAPEVLQDPVAPINKIETLPETSVLFVKDFHRFIKSLDVYRTLKNVIPSLKAHDRHIVFVSPTLEIPIELEKDITLLPFDLPASDELLALANGILQGVEGAEIEVDPIAIEAGRGLTLAEAENAMALSLIQTKSFSREILEAEKLQAVKKSGLLELYTPISEDQIGGLTNLRRYIHNRKTGFFDANIPQRAKPRGILLTGTPGCGKSLMSKVISSVFNVPLLRMDLSALKGGLVGETEQKTRQAWQVIRSVAHPGVVVWIDEIEKYWGGVASSNHTDGGTTSSQFGIFLTEMEETSEPVYFIATCNNINDLLNISQGALLRRFDDIFFVDVPSRTERVEILNIMNKRYGTDHPEILVDQMENWTGAEIEKFVKASLYDGPNESLRNIRPVYLQNKEVIDAARGWAENNARMANEKDVATATGKKGRHIKLA